MKYIKKIRNIFFSGCVLSLILSTSSSVLAEEEMPNAPGRSQNFIVTAYYSPVRNQSWYIRGTYEADIRLNGGGVRSADMTPVYQGMLAAPKSYPFGTKIYIPGLGIGEVHDRGGAILEAGDNHRIDVWMGTGEEGLARALNWGKRRVEGYIYDDPNSVTQNIAFDHIPLAIPHLGKITSFFQKNLFLGTEGDEVKKLQKYLKALGFFEGAETGNFDPATKDAVLKFQLSKKIVASHSQFGAGVFGPTTRKTLEDAIKKGIPGISLMSSLPVNPLRTAVLSPGMGLNEKGIKVKRLQLILKSLGYFTGDLTENYGEQTVNAVLAFQVDHGVIASKRDSGAGYYGQKTHGTLEKTIEDRKEKLKNIEERRYSAIIPAIPNSLAALPEKEKFLFQTARLRAGERGEIVKSLQAKLIAGNYLEKGMDTGFFGEQTKMALLKFQQDYFLIADEKSPGAGEFGPKTGAMMYAMIKK